MTLTIGLRGLAFGCRHALAGLAMVSLAACSGGGGGGDDSSTFTPPTSGGTPTSVTISGTITFDSVPHNSNAIGLNYSGITQEPVRGVTVQATTGAGAVLDSDVTDGSGRYTVTVDPNTNVRIQVRSEMVQDAAADWDIRVLDNTRSNALYILAGSLTNSGTSNSIRNLNAASGWTGAAYTQTRAAGPFAILDGIYDALADLTAVDATITFPDLQIFWSENNRSADGDIADGDIGTSSYTRISGVPTILILGDVNNDTDEYDTHVVVHEFGHYFEDQVARGDSIGGAHSLTDRLDPRVAFSEGWANAFSGMVLDPVYRDAQGAGQLFGFAFSVESNSYPNEGWFNEGSIQSILYDVFDSASDGVDTISAGLGPIYSAWTDSDFLNEDSFSTVFSYLDVLQDEPAVSATVLNALRAAQNINGTGPLGVGETNDGGDMLNLPVYKPITVGGAAVEVCSNDDNGTYNKLGNRAFLVVTVTGGSRTFSMTQTSGAANRNPEFRIWNNGLFFVLPSDPIGQPEIVIFSPSADTYIIEAFDAENTEDGGTRGDACYDFTVN